MSTKQPKATLDQIAKTPPRVISGIKQDRERPAGSGWCGKEDCEHWNHKHFNSPAKAIK